MAARTNGHAKPNGNGTSLRPHPQVAIELDDELQALNALLAAIQKIKSPNLRLFAKERLEG
jgi:hypothetical protein